MSGNLYDPRELEIEEPETPIEMRLAILDGYQTRIRCSEDGQAAWLEVAPKGDKYTSEKWWRSCPDYENDLNILFKLMARLDIELELSAEEASIELWSFWGPRKRYEIESEWYDCARDLAKAIAQFSDDEFLLKRNMYYGLVS